MVADCQIILSVRQRGLLGALGEETRETLYPPRHNITLPLNNLNFLFEKVTTSFNQTTELTSDK